MATLFGPKRIKARAIDWDQIHADFHQGARLSRRILDAVYMAAADQMSKLNNPLATQEPSIHGPRECPSKEYGPPKILYNRWKRWSDKGVFARIMTGLAAEGTQNKTIMIDATYLKAHLMASSLGVKKGAQRSTRAPDWSDERWSEHQTTCRH